KTVKLVRERLNPRLAIQGIVLTMFDGRTSLALQIRDEVHRYFPGEIFETVIPRNVRLSEAPSHGKPVMLHDLRSSGALAYLDLTREVIRHEYSRPRTRLGRVAVRHTRFRRANQRHRHRLDRGQPESA